ncbi:MULTISPECIES: DUF1772 domain-containing protein [Legionella]|uniref:DUF1772 domain-containing protein n=1 Tax=Legionella resiliens TaxID=2905958 RepID=A0ABS8X1V2_9GAMM|nr:MULTISPECIES: DUF1772 domain-containing protein [unclassified Legionella]MCE0723579.1 DUF1772 domain-containing protein [Legionella sp. 9fVS26]MCE3532733.1 DUF1772 domain-containing protein [Legionella sp. 8cVS16]QLZ68868.1 hypothetical protein FOLKNPGA_01648 [Legionella sp. PC1000]
MKTLRFITIMLTALSLSAAFAHLLELPAKLTYDSALWLNLLQTLYPTFGRVSGVCEIGAVVTSLVLVVAIRNHPKAFFWTLLAALCLVVTHAIFWIWVAPVNAALVPLSPDTLPPDWTRLRDQWEFAHASRAILQIVALAALVLSLLVELPPVRRSKQA